MRAGLASGILLTGLLGLAACGSGGGDAGADVQMRELHRGNSAEPLSLDPHKASGTWENNIIGDMFLGLTTEDAEGKPVPGVAESWTVSEDGLVWTFRLRDTFWSDGIPVTADDFVFGFRRLLNPETLAQYASLQFIIKNAEQVNNGTLPGDALGVRAIDEKTLEVTLESPAPYLPGLFTHYTAFPVPRHVVETVGDAWIQSENIVTNGAYVLREWRANDFVRVEKSETFYDASNVCFDEVFYYPTNDLNTGARLVISGELDLNTDFPGNKIDFYREQLGAGVRVHPYLSTTYLAFNVTKPPFDDVRVRQALAMSLDTEFITREVLGAGQIPAGALTPPGIDNYVDPLPATPWFGKPLEDRQAEARRLLEEAGYGPENPLRFEYAHRNTGDNPRVAPVIQSDWKSIAPWIDPDIAGVETQIHYDNLRAKNFEVADAGWVADYNDPSNFLYLLETRSGPMNYPGWSNAEYDGLTVAAAVEMDLTARAAIMAQAETLMLADVPVAPMWHMVSKALVNSDITGWVDNAVQIHRTRYMCRVQ
jgi:oligopeptide transport system substrate-binding protein